MRPLILSLKAVATLISYNTLLFVVPSLTSTSAHSWLDCTNMLESGCAGFPLGYPSRKDIDINTKYTYLIQDRRPDAAVCQPGRQNIPGNNPFPIANVAPGQNLHLTWQPDGHLSDAKPSTIEVHWAGVPGKQIYKRAELGPATLLGTMIFGTSANCDQPSEPNTWCHGHITVPQSTQPGTYQLIWWWKYDRNPSGEEYSTCFEITVNGDGSAIQSREVGDTKSPAQVATTPPADQVAEPEAVVNAPKHNQAPVVAEVSAHTAQSPEQVAPAAPTVPKAAAQVQVDAKHPAPQHIIIKTEPLQLAYMTEPAPAPAPGSSIAGGVNPPNVNTLADLSKKPDQPLNVIPNFSIIRESRNKDHKQVDGFSGDELGSLAGDAVNDSEGKDSSPLPLAKPSDLINTTLSAGVNGTSTTLVITNATSTVPSAGEKQVNHTVTAIPGFHPPTDASAGKDKDGTHNRNLVSQVPHTANSASVATAPAAARQFTITAALVSTVLATFTWMLV
ncbi:hypothetical protein BGX24_008840 [Mortierella sp. AD032]|nr:hypothetical protein BGX24_008840 [Mortierella sp. AD032]